MLRLLAAAAIACSAICSSLAPAAADDRSICGATPVKSDTIAACSRIIGAPRASDHDRALAYIFRANAFRGQGDTAHAIADFTDALTLLPNFVQALLGRGIAYLSAGDYPHALADFDAVTNLDPKNAIALYERGLAKQKSGDTAGGDADIAAAQKLDPNIAKKL
jgi:lipoprotein NlpI